MSNTEIYELAIQKINNSNKELFIPKLLVARDEMFDSEIIYNIFSHEFAKAFWGDDFYCTYYALGYPVFSELKVYQYHLQQMVLEKEPIKYLEKFL